MIFNGIEIDLSKIDFDFSKPFYIRSTSKNENLPSKESLFYLEFELNLNFQEIADFFKTKYYSIKCLSRRYGFPSKTPEQYQKREREFYKFRTGYSHQMQNPETLSKRKSKRIPKPPKEKIPKIKKDPNLINEKRRKTCLERFGVENPNQSKLVKEKKSKTCLERYGVSYVLQANQFIEKRKQTNLKRYGFENPASLESVKVKRKQTCLEKYGVESFSKTESYKNVMKEKEIEINQKRFLTKSKNHTFNSSKTELEILTLLKTKFQDVKAQYKDSRYPFACDFYIPSLDLFLEFQGTWTHGGHPFDETNPKDLELLELWKKKSEELNFKGKKKAFYKNAIYSWTILDPKKRKIAKENNLNFREFFSKKELEAWFKEFQNEKV